MSLDATRGAQAELSPEPGNEMENATLVYAGTYTADASKGIYLFRLQPQGTEVFQNVTLVPLGLAAETPNPSFLEIDLKRRLLFAVNEIDEFEGKPSGSVSAFSVGAAGKLALLNQQPSMGKRPCHLAVSATGSHLLVANCGDDSIAVLPIGADGRLGEATDVVHHTGASVDAERQAGPHPLGVAFDPDGRFAFVADLGLDKIMAYRFDSTTGKLTPHDPAFTPLEPGSGPRGIVFRPDGRFAYVLNELNSTVVAFSYDPQAGLLKELGSESTLPGYYDGPNKAAEIAMHPSGQYLFSSNDGHNSIVLYAIDADEGTLSWVEEQGSGGAQPRHFGIEPVGKHMAISNLGADKILASRIDPSNGRLKPSGIFAELGSPACIRFLPPAESGKGETDN